METENTKYDRIEDYLAGNLKGEALQQFEHQMRNDPALAEDVALLRDMGTLLRPSEEDALRANLAMLSDRYLPLEPVNNKVRNWWWVVAAAVLLIAFLGWWFLKSSSDELPVPPSNEPAVKETPPPPMANETDTKLPEEEISEPSQNPTVPKKNPPKKNKENPNLLASNFQPNPNLELMLDNQFRGDEYLFRIFQPVANAQLKLESGRANFLLSGVLETNVESVDATFRLLLFSNKPEDYENFKFLFSKKLTFEKDGDLFRFHVEEPLNLSPGLYYYLIEAEDSGMLFHVGKVKVQQ